MGKAKSIAVSGPSGFSDYELIDSGQGEKLERFGKYTLIRPEPQAVWSPRLSPEEWKKQADARFEQKGSAAGTWIKSTKSMPDSWYIHYQYKGYRFSFRLALTRFKHVGVFPEQAANWDFIMDQCEKIDRPRVLNLFAYTGGASLASCAAGADIIHCDSIKQVVSWARSNMEASKLDGIRWLVEDAFKFVKREAKRGNTYHGVLLDPPAWGHGPKGEKWKLEDQINELMGYVSQIVEPRQGFLVFNAYSLGFSSLILENLVRSHFPAKMLRGLQIGELCLPEPEGRSLPAGVYARFGHPAD